MKRYYTIIACVLIALAVNCSHANAQAGHKMLTPETMKWGDAPPGLPKGAKIAVLDGNPSGTGPFTVRLKFPKGYTLAPHWHPADETVTVISGAFKMGFGNKFDQKNLRTIPTDGFGVTPQKVSHYATVDEETIVQLTSMAPFQINYINPGDDPRNQKVADQMK
jgi:hypothetical protein